MSRRRGETRNGLTCSGDGRIDHGGAEVRGARRGRRADARYRPQARDRVQMLGLADKVTIVGAARARDQARTGHHVVLTNSNERLRRT